MEGVREVAEVSRWPDLQRGVAKAVLDYRSLGVCCSFGEWQKDINAIAVPIRLSGTGIIYSLGMAGLIDRLTRRPLDRSVKALRAAVGPLSKVLSGPQGETASGLPRAAQIFRHG